MKMPKSSWQLKRLPGRVVAMLDFSKHPALLCVNAAGQKFASSNLGCADCGEKARYVVVEIEDFIVTARVGVEHNDECDCAMSEHPIAKWFWCGECDIGV